MEPICEQDPHANPMGSKGIGEIGIAGAPAAVANAVYNATGIRVRGEEGHSSTSPTAVAATNGTSATASATRGTGPGERTWAWLCACLTTEC